MDAVRPFRADTVRSTPAAGPTPPAAEPRPDALVRVQEEDLRLLPSPPYPRESPPAAAPVAPLSDPVASAAFPRPLTRDEKADWRQTFPAMDLDKVVATGPATQQYNCISWTVGETHAWFWPPDMYPGEAPEQAFDLFYASYGLHPAPTGEVAVWRNWDGLTHGCVSGPGHGPRWESKCGSDLRVQHGIKDLESDVYGRVDHYYSRKEAPPVVTPFGFLPIPDFQKDLARERAEAVAPDTRERFAGRYDAWQDFRNRPEVRAAANPAVHCNAPAFDDIVAMGPDAVPLLMDRMAQGDFFCLRAVEAIFREHPGHAGLAPAILHPEERENSEQGKASLALTRWLQA